MLSYKDIVNELGKNIFIYPLKNIQIKGASLDLTASKFAWSLKTKKSICLKDLIVIPPHDTAIIFTNEAIHVTGKIAGSYHSKVSFVAEGLSHIGTTLDPHYIGLSKLAIHNNSDTPFELPVNHTIVSVMFEYVKTPLKKKEQPDCTDFVTAMNTFEKYQKFKAFVDSNNWIFHIDTLHEKMKGDSQYKIFAKDRDKGEFWKKPYFPHFLSLVGTLLSFSIIYFVSDTNARADIFLYATASICAQLPGFFVSFFKNK